MFCIFPPPSHSHAFFILSLLLGSSHCHPVTISVYFLQLSKRNVFTIIKDETAQLSVLCVCRYHNGELVVDISEISGFKNSISMKLLNIAFPMQVGFCIQSQTFSKNIQHNTLSFSFPFPESQSDVCWLQRQFSPILCLKLRTYLAVKNSLGGFSLAVFSAVQKLSWTSLPSTGN